MTGLLKQEIQTLNSRTIYQNRWMKLREDRIRRSDGSDGIYGVVEKPDFVVIAAIDKDSIHLVEQYRYPVGCRLLELPQGSWEGQPDAEPIDVARGELKEETGIEADQMEHIGHLLQAVGYSTQGYHIFLATGLRHGQMKPDPEEVDLITRSFPLSELQQFICDGVIKDATTVAAIGLLRMKGKI